jgi:hypothetical protein
MASRWFYRVFDQEIGPASFQDLAEMVRAGTLTKEDRVRREFSEDWIAAWDVIGLFRAAQAKSADDKPPEPEPAPDPPNATPRPVEKAAAAPVRGPRRRKTPRIGLRVGIAVAIVLVVATIAGYEFWSHRRSRVFPESALNRPRPADRQTIDAIRAPRPKVPSVPGLEEGKPTPIPGLEAVDPGFSPCLTADLKTIVYAAMPNLATGYDLYMATRDDVSKPFGTPRLIKSCRSRETDAYPSLSSDGLELFFERSDSRPRFYRAAREGTSSEFGPPVLWAMRDYDPDKKQRIGQGQLLDRTHFRFCFVDLTANTRKTMVAERSNPKAPFGEPRPSAMFSNAWPPWFVAVGGLRAYFATSEGLFLAARQDPNQSFGEGLRILEASVSGAFDGPVWVAPQEDVVFYVSSGPGKEPGPGPGDKGRKLWMMRF